MAKAVVKGLVVSEEVMNQVVAVKRVNERLMLVKLALGSCLVNVISGYAPQIGRSDQEKSDFWDLIEDSVEAVKDEEIVVI